MNRVTPLALRRLEAELRQRETARFRAEAATLAEEEAIQELAADAIAAMTAEQKQATDLIRADAATIAGYLMTKRCVARVNLWTPSGVVQPDDDYSDSGVLALRVKNIDQNGRADQLGWPITAQLVGGNRQSKGKPYFIAGKALGNDGELYGYVSDPLKNMRSFKSPDHHRKTKFMTEFSYITQVPKDLNADPLTDESLVPLAGIELIDGKKQYAQDRKVAVWHDLLLEFTEREIRDL